MPLNNGKLNWNQTCALAATLFVGALFLVRPAHAADAHCEAELGPGNYLISATFDDAGLDKAALLKQWTEFAVTKKAGVDSAKCTSGSTEEALDNLYGSDFVKTDWKPAK
jgi:hypothetical protein